MNLIDGYMNAWSVAGKVVVAAVQLAGLFALAALMFPLFVVGVIARLAWVALYVGFVSWEVVADWITDGKSAWRVRIVPEDE